MLNDEDFDKAKSLVVSMSPTQREAIGKLISKVNAPTTQVAAHGSATHANLYEDIRAALGIHNIRAPAFATAVKVRPWLRERVRVVSSELEGFLDREFKGCSRTERAAARSYLIELAVQFMKESRSADAESVLDAMMVTEQIVDHAFPGYRSRGVFREMVLKYLKRSDHRGGVVDVWA